MPSQEQKREIKFRWYDSFSKRMTSDCLFGGDSKGINEQIKMFSKDLIPMQFTGLKDKNGKEIYERDIVWINYVSEMDESCSYMAKIEFDEGAFCILKTPISQYMCRDMEIRGNIYENPNLLQ